MGDIQNRNRGKDRQQREKEIHKKREWGETIKLRLNSTKETQLDIDV